MLESNEATVELRAHSHSLGELSIELAKAQARLTSQPVERDVPRIRRQMSGHTICGVNVLGRLAHTTRELLLDKLEHFRVTLGSG